MVPSPARVGTDGANTNYHYRINVLADTRVLGFADVDVVQNGSQLRNVRRSAPDRAPVGPPSTWKLYFAYEHFDGSNRTYERSEDLRLVAEDADETIRQSLNADVPFIPAHARQRKAHPVAGGSWINRRVRRAPR
jgi:hypothetical protein